MDKNKFKLLEDNAHRYAEWHNQRTIKRLLANQPDFDYDLPLEELTRELAIHCFYGPTIKVPGIEMDDDSIPLAETTTAHDRPTLPASPDFL